MIQLLQHNSISKFLLKKTELYKNQTLFWQLNCEKWQSITWKDFINYVGCLSEILKGMGCSFGDYIIILMKNCIEWEISQHAIFFVNGVVVGIDPRESSENINYIFSKFKKIKAIIFDDYNSLRKIDSKFLDRIDILIEFRNLTQIQVKKENKNLQEYCFDNNHIDLTRFRLPNYDDPAIIVFTSGTTGYPKGILYTHGQIVLACNEILKIFSGFDNKTRLVCWLPLANLFQRVINYCGLIAGAQTFFIRNPKTVINFLPQIQPHIFIGVPRFYEKLYEEIKRKICSKSFWSKVLFNLSIKYGNFYAGRYNGQKKNNFLFQYIYGLCDKLVYSKVRNIFGSNLKYLISGSAPLSAKILRDFYAMGMLILEAYGVSENIIPIAINRPDHFKFGTVGIPLPINNVRLTSNGEILVKGPGVCNNYLFAENGDVPFTKDGFLVTGDIGAMDDGGFLRIIGRKSETFKTSTGRKVVPSMIEKKVEEIPYVEHALVFGEGKKFLVLLVSLSVKNLLSVYKINSNKKKSHLKEEVILRTLASKIRNDILQKTEALPSYLRPAAIILTTYRFSVSKGELTSNLKLRRKKIYLKFRKVIESLFDESNNNSDVRIKIV